MGTRPASEFFSSLIPQEKKLLLFSRVRISFPFLYPDARRVGIFQQSRPAGKEAAII